MTSKVTVPNLAFTNIAMPDAPKIRVAQDSLKASGAVTLDNPILMTEGGVKPSLEMLLTFKNTEGKYMLASVPAAGFTSSTVIAGMLRGIELSGIDLATENSDLDIDLLEGSEVVGAIPAQLFQLLFDFARGQIGSGGTDFIIGDATNSTITIKHIVSGSTIAWLRRNISTGKPQFSNDGTNWINLDNAGVGVLAAGNAIDATQLAAGTVQVNPTEDTNVFVKTSSGAGDENKAPILGADGKLAVGFIPGEEETLVAGENLTTSDLAFVDSDGQAWKSLRSASASGQLGAIAGTPTSISTLRLSDNTVMTIYRESGTLIKGIVSTIAQETATPGTETTLTAAAFSDNVRSVIIDTNKVAVVYKSSGDSKLYAVVCTISGTTITAGTPVKIYDAETINSATMDICKIDTDKFLTTATNTTSDDPIAVACTVSGTVITAGAVLAVEATTTVGATVCEQLTTDAACLIYDDGTNLSYVVLEVSGTTVTANTALDLYAGSITGSAQASGLIVLDTQNVLFYHYDSTAGALRISRIINRDDVAWAQTPSYEPNDDTYLQTGNTTLVKLVKFDDEKVGLFHLDASSAIRFKQYKLANNAFEEIFSQTISGITTAASLDAVSHVSNQNRAIMFITDGANLEYAIFNDTSNQHIGVVKTGVSATETVTLLTDKDAPISGLTAGQSYFVGDAGAVATSGQRLLGVATTTSNLRLI